ncbi:MAG: dTDP-4-dehydro-6-deoxyglucose aminotransferase, partial [Bacteroidetes bacterium]|nr:dTDP-4-dehydro-6-deoxyglucose aminotransferase [Bacteroidota bacterium]
MSVVNKMSIFSGEPAFADKLHVGRPNLGNRKKLMQRLNDILDRRWLSNFGHYVQDFEKKIAQVA